MNVRTSLIGPRRLLTNTPHVIHISGTIDGSMVHQFTKSFTAAVASGQYIIPIIIHSDGGNVVDAIAIIDLIKTSPVPVATIVPANAQSAAVLILSAGTEGYRYVGPLATLMLHQCSMGGICGTLTEVSNETRELKRVNDLMFRAMACNCKQESDYFMKLISAKGRSPGTDLYLNATQAKEHNIACHIGVPKCEVRLHARMWLHNDSNWRRLDTGIERIINMGSSSYRVLKRKRNNDDSDEDSDDDE